MTLEFADVFSIHKHWHQCATSLGSRHFKIHINHTCIQYTLPTNGNLGNLAYHISVEHDLISTAVAAS